MGMSPDDIGLFKRFLQKTSKSHFCSRCNTNEWVILESLYFMKEALGVAKTEQGWQVHDYFSVTGHGNGLMPIAVTMCKKCFRLEEFAWIPIKEWGERNGGE